MEHKQIVLCEYVFTPIKNAFNNKTSYWVSKKGCTIAMYAFTPWDRKNLKDMTRSEVLQSYVDCYEKMRTK